MKRWLLRLGMMFGSFALVLVLVEVVWQLLGDPRIAANERWLESVAPHSRLGAMGMLELDEEAAVSFRLKPGFEATIQDQVYRINAQGMRGPEIEKEKKAGAKRVLIVGDSYAFGYGVDESATISVQLEAGLREKHEGVEVLNLGVPAYHTGQEARVLERDGLGLDPDLVVLIYYPNDNIGPTLLYDPDFRVIYFDELPFSYETKHAMSGSILYYIVTKAYTQYLTRSKVLNTRGIRHWATTRERLSRVVEVCAGAKVRLLLVALPALTHSRELYDPTHEINKDHDRLLTFADDEGIPILDMRAPLLARQKPVEELFVEPDPPRRDTHLNRQGYKILVDNLVSAIEANKAL